MSEEVIAGRYELLELVGRGGMSSVWKAHDRLLDRTVAIKVLHEQYTTDEEYVERFRREARSVAQVSHPNIVTVIDRGEDGGRQYIVFEYVAGENLKQLIEREGPLPVHDALLMALQMARALGFAHTRGLIHRDVKPQNVLLNEDGQAKMTDFGIARSVDVQGVTLTGTVLGTSEYIAPEQARGQQVDALTDVYSLGVVLYELLTGGVPFQGESFVDGRAPARERTGAGRPRVPARLPAARGERGRARDGQGPGRAVPVDGRARRRARGLRRRPGPALRGGDDDRPPAGDGDAATAARGEAARVAAPACSGRSSPCSACWGSPRWRRTGR